jgi:hypothetical protein
MLVHMSNRTRIILTFATVMAVIFHARLFARWYLPICYIQIATTLAALVLLIFRSYKWIDYGSSHKWHFERREMKDRFGFQEQVYIKYTGWSVFLSCLTFTSIALLGAKWEDFIGFTHLPLVCLAIEFYIPYKYLTPINLHRAIQQEEIARGQAAPSPSSPEYQADPVQFGKKPPPERRRSTVWGNRK